MTVTAELNCTPLFLPTLMSHIWLLGMIALELGFESIDLANHADADE